MSDLFPPAVRRPALLSFAEACNTSPRALRRDERGDWAIFGSNGHIYAVPEGYQLMVGCELSSHWASARGWESAKRRLSFGVVTQDGDCEGAIMLDRLPNAEQAAEIRDILRISKRVEYSDEVLAAKRSAMSDLRRAPAGKTLNSALPASNVASAPENGFSPAQPALEVVE